MFANLSPAPRRQAFAGSSSATGPGAMKVTILSCGMSCRTRPARRQQSRERARSGRSRFVLSGGAGDSTCKIERIAADTPETTFALRALQIEHTADALQPGSPFVADSSGKPRFGRREIPHQCLAAATI